MSSADERKARNETIFRRANEDVRRVQDELGLNEGLFPFICECEDERCREIVQLTQAEYEHIRAEATRFLLAPGHPTSTGRIVGRSNRFWTGEKQGKAAEIAEATDPRAETSLEERERRIGENEVLYRTVNEKIEGLNRVFGTLTNTVTVVCECGRISCAEQLELDLADYERIRSDPTMFVVVPGHEFPTVETILEQHGTHDVVRKDDGGPAELAARNDPRS